MEKDPCSLVSWNFEVGIMYLGKCVCTCWSWLVGCFYECQWYQSCLVFAFNCSEGFLESFTHLIFLCLEWICFEMFIITLVFDVLSTCLLLHYFLMFCQPWAMKTHCISISLLIQHNFQFQLLVTAFNLQGICGSLYRNKPSMFSHIQIACLISGECR